MTLFGGSSQGHGRLRLPDGWEEVFEIHFGLAFIVEAWDLPGEWIAVQGFLHEVGKLAVLEDEGLLPQVWTASVIERGLQTAPPRLQRG